MGEGAVAAGAGTSQAGTSQGSSGQAGAQASSGAGSNSGLASGQTASAVSADAGIAGAGQGSGDWTAGFADEHRGFVQNKGWKNPAEVVDSYRNLEKLLGAPQEQMIRLPKEDDPAAWEGVFTRLGRPANPEGYKLAAPKEGGNSEFVKWLGTQFFKAGLSEKQGQQIANSWNDFVTSQKTAQKESYQARVISDTSTLKKEWGAAYDQNLNVAKRAAKEFGVDGKIIDSMEAASGFAATVKFFHSLGSKLGDASFVTGNPGGTADGPMTPQQARDRISALKADPSFVKKYIEGGADARAQMERLHRYAYPET